jgi:hypothetical protein
MLDSTGRSSGKPPCAAWHCGNTCLPSLLPCCGSTLPVGSPNLPVHVGLLLSNCQRWLPGCRYLAEGR